MARWHLVLVLARHNLGVLLVVRLLFAALHDEMLSRHRHGLRPENMLDYFKKDLNFNGNQNQTRTCMDYSWNSRNTGGIGLATK